MQQLNETQCIDLIKKGLKIKELREATFKSDSYLRKLALKNNLTITNSQKSPAIDAKEKECTTCKNTFTIDNFYRLSKKENSKEWKYFSVSCKTCAGKLANERRKNIKIQALEYKGWICTKCGLIDKTYPQIYDFHHLDPSQKEFSICKNVLSFDKIKNELDKCVVLCANCHRKEHSGTRT